MVALLALILLISAPSAEGFGWWGNSVPVSQIVEEGTEKMGQHLTTFFEMCDRFISARQKKWATESSSSTQDGDEEEAAAQGNDSPFLVERIFHPSAKAKQGMKRAPISNSTDRCSEPFGVSHPACDSTYACSITQALPPSPSCLFIFTFIDSLSFICCADGVRGSERQPTDLQRQLGRMHRQQGT